MKRHWLLIAFLVPYGLSALSPPRKYQARVAVQVWDAIAEKHFDKDFNKKYRKKVLGKYLPVAKSCKNDAELTVVLNKMVDEIGQSHIRVLPPVGVAAGLAAKVAASQMPPPPGTPFVPAGVGAEVCKINNTIRILRLRPGFPAAKAGIRPGDIINRINRVKIKANQPASIPWTLLGERLLWGLPQTKVKLELTRPGRKPAKMNYNLTRRANGGVWFKLGVMPRFASLYESRMLSGNIGYIRFSVFTPAMIMRIRNDVMGKFKQAKAIVIDLRNNPGGIIITPQWLAGWLSRKKIDFGKMINGKTVLNFKSYPQTVAFAGPLAILINGGTGSAAEICAAGFQDADAAELFGVRSSGRCLASQFVKLKHGFRLQAVFGDLIRANGKRIEHVGVKPDVIVKQDAAKLSKGRDTVLDAAVNYLKKAKRP
jgi:carboxyl-terminal processing protease